jgi:hypothetical protein
MKFLCFFVFLFFVFRISANFPGIITLKPTLGKIEINRLHQLLEKTTRESWKTTRKDRKTKNQGDKTSNENLQSFFDPRITKPTGVVKNKYTIRFNGKLGEF